MSEETRGGSGRTQALDLDDFDSSQKKKRGSDVDDWSKSDSGWEGDPWGGGQRQRGWAEDKRWTGDDGTHKEWGGGGGDGTMALDLDSVNRGDGALVDSGGGGGGPESGDGDDWGPSGGGGSARGWGAPKRDEMLASGDGWDDWNEAANGDGTMALAMDDLEEQKELGGRRKRQAARSYERDSSSSYGSGKAKRQDIYRQKEDMDAEGRGLQSYGGGKREIYGAQESFGNDDWSSNPDAGRGPAPGERRAAPPGGMPKELPPDERTVALDIDSPDAASAMGAGGGQPQTLNPNESTVALNDVSEVESLSAGMGAGGAQQAQDQPTEGSLVIFSPDNPPVPYELGPGVTSIGRGLDNDVVLSDPFTSRKHFLIVHRDGQFEVRDSGTDNGTNINGQRVQHALLRPGDHIEVGNTVLRFVPGVAGEGDMQFGPPPPVPPHHLAPPPDGGPAMMGPGGSMAQPMSPMGPGSQVQQPEKKGKGGLIAFLLIGFLLVAGGIGAALYFFVLDKGDESSASSDEDTDVSTEAGVNETGFDQAGANTGSSGSSEGAAAAGTAETGGAASGAAAKEKEEPAEEAKPEADPVLVADLVGSVAMATGKARPLPMTVAFEPVTIKIDSDPTDARIYDQNGNLQGRTPYEREVQKGSRSTTWTLKKSGYRNADVKVDFSTGVEESVDMSKKRRRKRRKKKKKEPAIPIVD